MHYTLTQLGRIMLKEVGAEVTLASYGTKDPEEVGRLALIYKDMNRDGSFN